jgi:UDP-glucose 4-epimerase
MASYVVTGGAGFIGSHLVDMLLARGHTVTVIDDMSTGRRENLDGHAKLILGDVADPKLTREVLAEADGCFHLAAVASVARANADWIGTHRTNQTGTVSVMDAARAAGGIPVVYASSAAVYGQQTAPALHEGLMPAPLSAYGADKYGSELHGRVAFGVHRVPTTGLRFFNVYGPRQDPKSPYSGVISIFADRIASGAPIVIDGDGGQTRDFIYVTDVVRHLVAAMSRLHATPEASVFNVCTGTATSILALAREIGAACEVTPEIGFGPPRPGDMRSALGDPALALRELRVAALTGLPEGLRATVGSLLHPADLAA